MNDLCLYAGEKGSLYYILEEVSNTCVRVINFLKTIETFIFYVEKALD